MKYGRFVLEKYAGKNTRHICPACGDKGRTFTKYIDTETGEVLPENYGRCDREIKCGYHLRPGNELDITAYKPTKHMQPQSPNIDYIPATTYEKTLGNYERNSLYRWMHNKFGFAQATKAFHLYKVGTSKQWGGSPIFWQFDEAGRCRSGKVMGYNEETGKRVREPHPQITWVHSLLKIEPFNFSQVLFGLHLAEADKHKGIGIVESEKTAIICSIAEPNIIWLATGGIQNLTRSKLYPLRKRKIVLYPDLGAYDKWAEKAAEAMIECEVSNVLEKMTGVLPSGFDMGDLNSANMDRGVLLNKYGYPAEWD